MARSTRRQFIQTATAAASGLALTNCGWTLAEVRATGSKGSKDELFVYTWTSYIDDQLLSEFTAQTGIKVKADIFDSDDVMLNTFQAGKGVNYSIIYPSAYGVERMIELKLLLQLDQSKLIGLDSIKPKFRDPPYDPGNRYSIPISWGTTGLIYNSEKLPTPPEDWDYLWKNKDKLFRRMTLLNDVREVMGAVLRSLGYSYNSKNLKEIERAYQKLEELRPAIRLFTTDAWKEQILAGDIYLAMGYSSDGESVTQENPKLKYVIPRSGTSLWSDNMVIPKTAPNPDGAYAWINYMSQPSVAASVCRRLSFATPNQGAFDQLPLDIRENPTLFPPDEILEKCESIAPVGDAAEIYDNYWTKLTSS
ncbi:polyamine ABC transporter substrate-binding protein [Leptolyngbya sp. 'hensonii']|uniref:ABC transporter substrate-binding protein n=1 Tax=Leptolyngbya sp. 'hensonii' TaxID=1922337 RepID=UPI00094F8504|nr:spermidine/putrescine ABC transporter substrate-binding protein [Leptolyngbya sp. 'hensonii']OLP18333.1 polyamine ABC transporter substrate-binding protein [Leptolyngbya sp. 'hensonii']